MNNEIMLKHDIIPFVRFADASNNFDPCIFANDIFHTAVDRNQANTRPTAHDISVGSDSHPNHRVKSVSNTIFEIKFDMFST